MVRGIKGKGGKREREIGREKQRNRARWREKE